MTALFLALMLAAQDDNAAKDAIAACDATFAKSKDSTTRVAAVGELARTHHEKVITKLGTFLTDPDKQIRACAAQGLGGYVNAVPEQKKSAAHALTGAMSAGTNAKDPEVLALLLGALGSLQEESAGNTIKGKFDEKDTRIAGAAISAAGNLKSKTMVEPLIDLFRDCEKHASQGSAPPPSVSKKPLPQPKGGGGGNNGPDPEAAKRDRAANLLPTIAQALNTLTGQSCANAAEWERWWAKNRNSFTIPK